MATKYEATKHHFYEPLLNPETEVIVIFIGESPTTKSLNVSDKHGRRTISIKEKT